MQMKYNADVLVSYLKNISTQIEAIKKAKGAYISPEDMLTLNSVDAVKGRIIIDLAKLSSQGYRG